MSINTWNFPTFQDRDGGPTTSRGTEGSGFGVTGQTLFSNALSGVVSFLLTSETATATDIGGSGVQYLHTIGYRTAVTPGLIISVKNEPSGTGYIEMNFYDKPNATQRYLYRIGDEDGVSGLKLNKWYQLAFSADATSFQYVMNGSTTPLIVGTPTSTPGTLNLNANDERWAFWGGAANGETNWSASTGQFAGWSSVLRGPSAFEGSALDLSDAAVRARIFDAEGNLKTPGENGSGWYNDAYTTAAGFKPDVYMVDGSPRMEKGSLGLTFDAFEGPGTAQSPVPGGLRKFYE